MSDFKSIFGIERSSVQKNCLLVPFVPPGTLENLGIRKLSTGFVFSAGNIDGLTIIKTGMGAGLTGDACLYLSDTACQNMFFFGSCGAIDQDRGLAIGDLVLPLKAYAFESFSDILNNRLRSPLEAAPDAHLVKDFISLAGINPREGHCISFASLHEEEKWTALFQSLNADIIEMECAAFFLAAQRINRRAMALVYVSDILKYKRFYEPWSSDDKKRLAESIGQACQAFLQFIKT
jgi:purine-nucleoside phosphorylase